MKAQLKEFLADLRLNGRMLRTVEGHEQELLRLGRWLDDEGLDWRTLTRKQLQRYTRLRSELGHSSRSNMLVSLRTFYRWAVEQEYVTQSPAVAFKTPKKPHPQPRALTMEQVRTLVDYLRAEQGRRARRDEALLLTALYAGLRANELAKLCWPDVDTTAGIINIELSKMGHGRSVTVHPSLAGVLLRWRDVQSLNPSAPVFSLDGLAFGSNRVGKIATKTRKATGLPLTAHVLRHTFATWALRRSRDLYSVSKALGHKQLAQTEIYISTDIEGIRPALDKLPGLEGW